MKNMDELPCVICEYYFHKRPTDEEIGKIYKLSREFDSTKNRSKKEAKFRELNLHIENIRNRIVKELQTKSELAIRGANE